MTDAERIASIKVLLEIRKALVATPSPNSKKLLADVDMKIESLMGPLG